MTSATLNPFLQEAIPTPLELLDQMPLKPIQEEFIHTSRNTIKAILQGKDRRKILIVGPCSIHDEQATYEYALKLKYLSDDVKDHFFIVMRSYFEKPRTSMGWKGFLYDPHLDGSYDIAEGLFRSRQILLELAHMQVPAGSELLELNTAPYLADLLSWSCIGARTCSSPTHRQLAASLSMPIGFKNSTDGDVINAINGILSANTPQYFLGMDQNGNLNRIHAPGNPDAHLVLRGGDKKPNYDAPSIQEALERCRERRVLKKIFIDCAHDNSRKCPENQIKIFQSVMHENNPAVVGLMLESHLHLGSQPITPLLQYGVSITDPCLDWDSTETLIRNFIQ